MDGHCNQCTEMTPVLFTPLPCPAVSATTCALTVPFLPPPPPPPPLHLLHFRTTGTLHQSNLSKVTFSTLGMGCFNRIFITSPPLPTAQPHRHPQPSSTPPSINTQIKVIRYPEQRRTKIKTNTHKQTKTNSIEI